MSAAPPAAPATDRRALAIYAALAGVVAAVCYFAVPAISRDTSHFGREVLAGLGIAVLAARMIAARLGRAGLTQGLVGVLLTMTVAGWFNYYQFDRRVFAGIDDYVDITYYYLNSKYLDQLGYGGFYAAMLVADQEVSDHHTHEVETYRDLRTDEIRPVSEAIAYGKELEATRFTPELWRQFQADNDFFQARMSRETMVTNFYVDHGYNPPPTWTIVGGSFAQLVDVQHLKWITAIDFGLVGIAFAGLGYVFGVETMLWAMLFFVVTFSGRWPILGQALFRFDWSAALILALCAYRKQWWTTAGGLLAYAALNRVFPAIFFLGAGAAVLGAWVDAFRAGLRTREAWLPTRYLRFAAGAAVVTVLLVGGALARYGPQTFADSAANLKLHNESFSSHRVGLATVLVWRGETTRADMKAAGGMAPREKQVQAMMPVLRVIGLVLAGLLAVAAIRSRKAEWETLAWAIVPFYVMTTPQVNYYNTRLIPVAWHAARFTDRETPWSDRVFHAVALALLLLDEVATQSTKVALWERHGTNAIASWFLVPYLLWLCAGIARWAWRPAKG